MRIDKSKSTIGSLPSSRGASKGRESSTESLDRIHTFNLKNNTSKAELNTSLGDLLKSSAANIKAKNQKDSVPKPLEIGSLTGVKVELPAKEDRKGATV